MKNPSIKENATRNILYPNDLPAQWFGVDYHCELYSGCEYKCIYCPENNDFYNINIGKISAKINIEKFLSDEISRLQDRMIGFGYKTEHYMPFEESIKNTQTALRVIYNYKNPIHITTKSDLILRDLPLISQINKRSFAGVAVSVMCEDGENEIFEPGVVSTTRRFEVLGQLKNAGIYCGILVMPILPFVTDSSKTILRLIEMASEYGADFAIPYFGVDLNQNIRSFYYSKIEKYYHGFTEMYKEAYGNASFCKTPRFNYLKEVFFSACENAGLEYNMQKLKHFIIGF